ncbi:hypothetical protein RM96_07370 [Cupriavidus sp. IDO]|nr:hypothetical protein RM96_07370 [Cupriavidus sp. IDO]
MHMRPVLLYRPVRKGSRGTPAEVLQAFWQELRGRTCVTIDHPGRPFSRGAAGARRDPGRLDAGRTELEAARRQLDALRTQVSTELERAREAVTLAQERAEASERRSLRELDQERTARQKSERAAEDLRGELVAARSEARDAAVAQAEGRAKLEAQAAALADRLAVAGAFLYSAILCECERFCCSRSIPTIISLF